MSTPEFGVSTLQQLVREQYEIVGVVCQPDKPVGRGLRVAAPPVKLAAQNLGVPVLQFANLRDAPAIRAIEALQPDLILVAAYGQYIPDEIVAVPPRGCLNLHPSLLPRWRGAAPATAAILAGDAETGVTVHFVVSQMDAGDILAQERTPIRADDTTATLMARLGEWGAAVYLDTVAHWLRGEITPRAQDHSQATWCGRMTKAEGKLDWTRAAGELARQVRAFQPWPGAFTFWQTQQLDILEALPLDAWRGDAVPGQVIVTDAGLLVAAGRGALRLRRVQLAGRRALGAEEFLRGARDLAGTVLGDRQGG